MTETKIDDTAPEAVYFPWDPEGSILNQPVVKAPTPGGGRTGRRPDPLR